METKDPSSKGGGATNGSGKPPAAKAKTDAERILASAPAEQIGAAMAAKKHERAADLLELHGERMLAEGEQTRLTEWVDALPDSLVKKKPRLAVLHAWLLVYGQRYQAAVTRLSEAERALRALEMSGAVGFFDEADDDVVALEPFADLKHSIRAVRAHIAWMQGDLSNLPESVDDAMLASSAEHPVWRSRALVTLGRCRLLAGALVDAAEDLDAAIACTMMARGSQARIIELEALVLMGRVREAQANLDKAQRHYEEVLSKAKDAEAHADARAAAEVGLGRIALDRGDFETAASHLERGLARVADTRSPSVGLDGSLAWATLLQERGDNEGTHRALTQAERFLKDHGIRWATEIIGAHRARLALRRDDVGTAKRWSQQFGLRGGDKLGPIREAQQVTYGMCLIAQGELEAAIAPLEEARESASAGGRGSIALDAHVQLAVAHLRLGGKDKARDSAAAALRVAAPGGIQLPFLGIGRVVTDLLGVANPKDAREKTLAELIARRVSGGAEAPASAAPAASAKPASTSKGGGRTPIETKQPVPDPPREVPAPAEAISEAEAPHGAPVGDTAAGDADRDPPGDGRAADSPAEGEAAASGDSRAS